MKVIDSIPIWFRRILTVGILIVVVGFIGLGVLAKCNKVDEPPSAKEAPWAIQTTSRVYYAKEFRLNGETPEIKGYWTFDGKRYHFNEGVKEFEKAIWGKVAIVKRTVIK